VAALAIFPPSMQYRLIVVSIFILHMTASLAMVAIRFFVSPQHMQQHDHNAESKPPQNLNNKP